MVRVWPDGSATVPTVSAEFGVPHPITGYHRGIDLIGWETIRAADAGNVIFAGWNGTAGYEVKIRHDDGYFTRYLHLAWFYGWSGQRVEVAQELGIMGDTGEVTGVHLHFEVIAPDGATRINPRDYIGTPTPPPPTPKEDEDMRIISSPLTRATGQYVAVNGMTAMPINDEIAVILRQAGWPAHDYDDENSYNAELNTVYGMAGHVDKATANAVVEQLPATATSGTLSAVSVVLSVLSFVGILALVVILV